MPDTDRHEHDLGLAHDLPRIVERGLGRRGLLGMLGGLGAVTLAGCADDDGASSSGRPPGGSPPAGSEVEVADGEIPEETAGPFPGDGSNGPNVLAESGVVRSDITASFGSASGVAEGAPLTVRFKVYDLAGEEATALGGAAVYLWHCDREGRYSMYDGEVAGENYLRGVQEADADGVLEFITIFPGAYPGRWPHLHFEVYPSLVEATGSANKLRTSQLAFPEDVCAEVYDGAEGYEQSATNLSQTSLETDSVFADGFSLQLAHMSGSVSEGYVATLNIPV